VWRARHLRLPDKQVAVKFLLNEDNNAELLARFRREAEVTSKLGHPNIVGVMDFNVLPSGMPYIVLEYLEGESLTARIERGPVPLQEALAITRQIASALHAAHKIGVVHRDLKPDNVFLVPSESGGVVAKVLDFGISKMRDNVSVKTQESTILGTPQYMSPEQANGKSSEVDARSDLWALGTIVYEMLTGHAAFQGESMTTLLVAVLVTPSPSLRGQPGVPDHVADALDRALAKDPADRQPDVPSFIAELTGAPLTQQRAVVD
jgi:serine/threonine-protein kinase